MVKGALYHGGGPQLPSGQDMTFDTLAGGILTGGSCNGRRGRAGEIAMPSTV